MANEKTWLETSKRYKEHTLIIIMNIFKERMHPNKYMNILLKVWAGSLLALAILGLIGLLHHICTNPESVSTATFGIFDTLG